MFHLEDWNPLKLNLANPWKMLKPWMVTDQGESESGDLFVGEYLSLLMMYFDNVGKSAIDFGRENWACDGFSQVIVG